MRSTIEACAKGRPGRLRSSAALRRAARLSPAAALAGLLCLSSGALAQQGGPRPVVVDAQPVEVRTIAETVSAVGTLRADQAITVRPEVPGVITEIGFTDGAPVKAGQVLFRLDDTVPRAELRQAETALNLSSQNYQRALDLFAARAGTARARDEATAKFENDKAAVALAKAKLEKMTVRAPFSGIAGLRRVDHGAYVLAGQDLVTLDDIDPIKADFEVPERYLAQVGIGQTARLAVDSFPGRSFAGKVIAVSPRIDVAGRSVAVQAEVPNPDGMLRPGLFARVTLVIGERTNAVLVPEQALVPQREGHEVFTVVDGTARAVPVEVGLRREGKAQIVSGLSAGDVVVVAGQDKLKDGTAVRVRPEPRPEG